MRRMVSPGLVVAACLAALLWAAPSAAQPRGPRPVGPRVGVGFYYGPYFYNPWFYSSFWWYPPYGYGYPLLRRCRGQHPSRCSRRREFMMATCRDRRPVRRHLQNLGRPWAAIIVYEEGYKSTSAPLPEVGSSQDQGHAGEARGGGRMSQGRCPPRAGRPGPGPERSPRRLRAASNAPPVDIPPLNATFRQAAIRAACRRRDYDRR
jgi:hypothetical protein